MKKGKILLYLMILIGIILCIPSIIYLFNNKTVDGFDSYYTYTLVKTDNIFIRIISAIIIVGLLLVFSVCYLYIIKKHKTIFKNKKQIMIFIAIISLIFMMILPYLSSDIFYYIGSSWSAAKYNANPYYTCVEDLQNQGINDEILNNTGYWKNTTSVYGPLWNIIAEGLAGLSFGNITIALFVFKIASFFVHMLNVYIIYKITKSRKYMLLYGLNPLVLIEFLGNVHNDIYLILFLLLAIYFLVKQKNIVFTIIYLALSISIKYSSAIMVPFILLYYFRNKSVIKRVGYCIITGVSIVALIILFYLRYYQDITVFTNMLIQGTKYSQSILLIIMEKATKIFEIVEPTIIPLFLIIFMIDIYIFLFKDKIKIREVMKTCYKLIFIFIFVVLATFQKYYILWLFPIIMWQSRKTRTFYLYLTITAIVPSISYFLAQDDPYNLGMGYSIEMLIISGILLFINLKVRQKRLLKNNSLEKN